MRIGERGPAVAILQGALIDLGYKMPISTRRTSRPDGKFGSETKDTVYQFQVDHKLRGKDGIAGQETFTELDRLLKAGPPSPLSPPAPPPPPPLPSTRDYEIGTGDPPIKHDPGAGPWNSTPKRFLVRAEKEAILEILPSASIYPGPNAATHMLHYMDNTGTTHVIDLQGMISDVPSARKRFENEVSQAQKFVEMLPPGTYNIRSKMLEQGYNGKNENADWYFAVGGYSTWGVGQATVRDKPSGREYELNFEYKFCDRYNWDRGKQVTILGVTITDVGMGEFHREGLAREFDMTGSVRRIFRWK
jgi:hypothetical protein